MTYENSEKRIEELVELLNYYSRQYYTQDKPVVSDKDYDLLYDELKRLEAKTGIVLPQSPTVRVGDVVLSQFQKYTHKGKLWSLDKGQSVSEIEDWHNRNVKAVEEYNSTHVEKLPELKYIITKKFDGLTINCSYDTAGRFIQGATRGTGAVGEDITAQAKTIKALPLTIENDFFFEIHGEAIMTKGAFDEYNKYSEVPLKNLRNGAAGALRNLNVRETAKRNLSAFFYDVGYSEGQGFESYRKMLEFIKAKGFPIDDYIVSCSTIEEIKKEIQYIEGIRFDLDYDIDGLVIAIDDIKTREYLGYTIKFPKWAIAFKFEAQEATTLLLDVEWNVGRSGRVTPTAILEPVELAGVTVKRATLNNMDDIARKGVRLGSTVFVRRSNDVIPEIMGAVEGDENNTSEILAPINCPSCNSVLVRDGVHYFCENTLSCKPQMVKSIVHFGSREAMNIEGFSEKTAEQLYEELDIKSIAELYTLTKEQLLKLDKFKDKKALNLLTSIENSKNCDLAAFIYALGIPNVGKKTAQDLVAKFKNLQNIMVATTDELLTVNDIGEIVANSITEFFSKDEIQKSIEDLLKVGIAPSFEESEVVENPFMGKTVVATGSLVNYSRTGIQDKLNSLGAKVAGSVSKKTDFVIVGADAGSKYTKALELGVKTLTEEEFEAMLSL